ncbi:MAG: hypothetical protein KDA69_08385 [Planctomycetaceae bacterium]|nr:hypothetical protein [Planctomycetaceae bacterium]
MSGQFDQPNDETRNDSERQLHFDPAHPLTGPDGNLGESEHPPRQEVDPAAWNNAALYGALGDAVPVSDEFYDRIVKQAHAFEGGDVDGAPVASETAEEPGRTQPTLVDVAPPANVRSRTAWPPQPKTLRETGLTPQLVHDLLLKTLYFSCTLSSQELSNELRLPCEIVEELVLPLYQEQFVEVTENECDISLTNQGRERARAALQQSRYVGPAPVSLRQYQQYCQGWNRDGIDCHREDLLASMKSLVLPDDVIEAVGAAICRAKPLLITGVAGSGISALGTGIGRYFAQLPPVAVPYAIAAGHEIMSFFDSAVHQQVTGETLQDAISSCSHEVDLRWRLVHRPFVRVGLETLSDKLSLSAQSSRHVLTAPIHIKANGGVLFVDDLGRRCARENDWLARWFVILDQHAERQKLPHGTEVELPVESLIVFGANLESFTPPAGGIERRFASRVCLSPPALDVFQRIFLQECELRNVPYNSGVVADFFLSRYSRQRLPKTSDPQDLLDALISICRFKRVEPILSADSLSTAFDRCLGGIEFRATG